MTTDPIDIDEEARAYAHQLFGEPREQNDDNQPTNDNHVPNEGKAEGAPLIDDDAAARQFADELFNN